MIARRTFVTTMTLGALAARRPAGAQAPAKAPKVGYLGGGGGVRLNFPPFLEALQEHGFVDGKSVIVERLSPQGASLEQYPALARRLLAGRPDVVLAVNPLSIEAVRTATRSIPIVAVDLESDPVARGWIASLARPGGNLTGFFLDVPEISGKQLQFLQEAKPGLTRVAVLGVPQLNELQFRAADVAGKTAGLTLDMFEVKTLEAISGVIADAARQRAGALLALTSPLILSGIGRIAESALKHRLPAISPFVPQFAEAGGLLAYGPDLPDLFRRAGGYVGRILKGVRAEDLPAQRPEKFELAVNLKTARALGITLPIGLVQRADRVIE